MRYWKKWTPRQLCHGLLCRWSVIFSGKDFSKRIFVYVIISGWSVIAVGALKCRFCLFWSLFVVPVSVLKCWVSSATLGVLTADFPDRRDNWKEKTSTFLGKALQALPSIIPSLKFVMRSFWWEIRFVLSGRSAGKKAIMVITFPRES